MDKIKKLEREIKKLEREKRRLLNKLDDSGLSPFRGYHEKLLATGDSTQSIICKACNGTGYHVI